MATTSTQQRAPRRPAPHEPPDRPHRQRGEHRGGDEVGDGAGAQAGHVGDHPEERLDRGDRHAAAVRRVEHLGAEHGVEGRGVAVLGDPHRTVEVVGVVGVGQVHEQARDDRGREHRQHDEVVAEPAGGGGLGLGPRPGRGGRRGRTSSRRLAVADDRGQPGEAEGARGPDDAAERGQHGRDQARDEQRHSGAARRGSAAAGSRVRPRPPPGPRDRRRDLPDDQGDRARPARASRTGTATTGSRDRGSRAASRGRRRRRRSRGARRGVCGARRFLE